MKTTKKKTAAPTSSTTRSKAKTKVINSLQELKNVPLQTESLHSVTTLQTDDLVSMMVKKSKQGKENYRSNYSYASSYRFESSGFFSQTAVEKTFHSMVSLADLFKIDPKYQIRLTSDPAFNAVVTKQNNDTRLISTFVTKDGKRYILLHIVVPAYFAGTCSFVALPSDNQLDVIFADLSVDIAVIDMHRSLSYLITKGLFSIKTSPYFRDSENIEQALYWRLIRSVSAVKNQLLTSLKTDLSEAEAKDLLNFVMNPGAALLGNTDFNLFLKSLVINYSFSDEQSNSFRSSIWSDAITATLKFWSTKAITPFSQLQSVKLFSFDDGLIMSRCAGFFTNPILISDVSDFRRDSYVFIAQK